MSTVVIPTGGANIASVTNALERLGAEFQVSEDKAAITGARHVILPGVGYAAYAMERLQNKNLVEVVRNLKQPTLGICLGMQILFESSEEGDATTLGIIEGQVSRLPTAASLPLPHMGWNNLSSFEQRNPLLAGITAKDYFYFVHSYRAPDTATIASTTYGSQIPAIVQRDNLYGCQFHPEKSGSAGARLLQNFLGL